MKKSKKLKINTHTSKNICYICNGFSAQYFRNSQFETNDENIMLFQKNIIKKYISYLDCSAVETAWNLFKNYFLNPDVQQNIRQSKEEQFQEGFLRELFVNVFGYTLNPNPNYNLITEQKNETNSKKADGAIIIGGKIIGVIELKDHKTTDLSKVEVQAFGYKSQHPNARYIIISNFEKIRLYIDNAVDYREWNLFSINFQDFKELYLLLAFKDVERLLAVKIKEESISNEDQITNALYKDYTFFKRVLYEDILKNNQENEDSQQLYKKTQKLLDRFLFIFFAEDCGLLPPNTMMKIISDWEKLAELDAYVPLYDRIRKYFGYLDTGYKGKDYEIFAYNGGLFKTDEILDSLKISDNILKTHTKKLSEYNFESEVDVNILGHIFENSLNDNGDNKRKKDGVFYTPQYITKYIVENTVGKLCDEKKHEFGIVENEYFADKKRDKDTKLRLLEKLDNYRQWLLKITILDPACGSGAFLNAALQFLMAEHRLIDEMEAKITGASLVMPNIENSILENNLFGVDINEESVEIAKLSLWLRTAKPHRKLNNLNQNIKCGNSLISDPEVAGSKAFDWQKEFPQVFENGGFDVVIGNPPYVNIANIQNENERKFYQNNYKTVKNKCDLYSIFTEKSKVLLKLNGLLGFIFPNSWLGIESFSLLRDFLTKDVKVTQMVELPEKVFADATVKTMLCFYQNTTPTSKDVIDIYKCNENQQFSSKGFVLPYSQLIQNPNTSFSFEKPLNLNNVDNIQLKRIASFSLGIKTSDDKRFICNEKKDEDCFKILRGRNLNKYSYPQNDEYIWYKPELITQKVGGRPRIKENFTVSQKIVIQDIAQEINATIDTEKYLCNDTINIIFEVEKNFDMKYILVLLNSKLVNIWFKQIFPSGLHIKINQLEIIPIPIISLSAQQPFIEKADKMLSLHSDLQKKSSRFLSRITESYNLSKITQNLEKFYELDFKAFVKELEKWKIKLSLVQKDELEDYFNQYKNDCAAIKSEIETTDTAINKMVYQLYGLSEEEIKIVDGE